ncbi:MAG: TetR/AcrR family transcriptional regulator [Dorea sp.]
MDKFLALPKEKQDAIIEAGYSCFAQMGYKKASAADIAAKAGISKAMIFHYFGCKKNMYLHLVQCAFDEVDRWNEKYMPLEHADFFSRFIAKVRCQSGMLQSHPAVMAFLLSVRIEDHAEVKDDIMQNLQNREMYQQELQLFDADKDRFKEDVKPELVMHLLSNYIENIARKAAVNQITELDSIIEEVIACVEMLKRNLYKDSILTNQQEEEQDVAD